MSEINTLQLGVGSESPLTGVVSFLKILRKHWAVVVSCVVIACGITLLYSKSVTRIYESQSLVEINPRMLPPIGDGNSQAMTFDVSALFADPQEYYATQYRIITSSSVLKAAVEAVSLQADYEYFGLAHAPDVPIKIEDAAKALAGHVSVDPVKGSRLAYIKVTDTDPARAKRLCDAVATAYVEQNLETAVSSSADAVTWLGGQIDHIKEELDRDENALYDFKEKNDLPSISINDSSNMLRLEMQEYDTELTHTKLRKAELLARQSELAQVTPDNPDAIPSSELLANNYLQELRAAYRQAAQVREELLAQGKGENHPLVKEADKRVADARKALLTEVDNIHGAIARDLQVVQKEEETQAGMFGSSKKSAVDLNMKEIEYHRLDRAREENEKLYSLLQERMKEADLARMMRSNNLRIVETATLPGAPIYPRVSANVAIGLVLGFLVGLALPLIREQLDSSLKTPNDIEQKLDTTFLGLLPELKSEEKRQRSQRRRGGTNREAELGLDGPPELVVHLRPTSGVSEAARSIRTNLMFMNPDKPCRTLLISSAAPAEGKTTVACSIAIAFAQSGQRVCIVDADLRRPRLHRIFGRTGDAGLTSALVGDATIDEVAKPTIVPNLSSIPAGPLPPNPADILQSERFRRLITDLGAKFDRVIVDSPPLVAVTDSAIISTLVDGTVFVVRAFETSKHLSVQGLRALRDLGAPIIGAVLNAVNLNRNEYDYYHYYYYKREGYASKPIDVSPEGSSEGAAPPPN